jgi:tetratricopeptide (TPR) repeat protein
MGCERLAAKVLGRLTAAGLWLLLAAWAGPVPCRGADTPKAKPLTEEQEARLKERDRLVAEARKQYQAGKLADAAAAMEKVVAIERTAFGKTDVRVANALMNLASLQEQRNEFKAAIKAREEMLAIATKVYGGDYWWTIDARWALDSLRRRARLSAADRKELGLAGRLNQQEMVLYGKGRYKEALPLAQRVAEILKRIMTQNHPDYAKSLNNLAVVYQAMGDYRSALALYVQARDLRKQLLTENHPDYAQSLHNLAGLYRLLGEYRRALALYRQAHDLRKELLTEDHPDYAISLNGLAVLYQDMGDYRKALPLMQQARDLRKKLLTEGHPLYAESLNNLAALYQVMGDYRSALPLYQQARDVKKKLLTEDHPDYALSLSNLALLYQELGDYRRALPLFQQARDLNRKLLTESHPRYANCLNNLGMLYRATGDYRSALPLLQQARDLNKKLLTEEHPEYAATLNNLAMLYQDMNDYAKALPLLVRARDLTRKLLTEEHPEYATTLNNLAMLYQAMGDYPKVLSLYEQACDLRKQLLTEDHPRYADSLNNLAALYRDTGDYRRALPLAQQTSDLYKKLLTENHPLYVTSLNNLALTHQGLGKPREGLAPTRQGLAINKRLLNNTFGALSVRQRLEFARTRRISLFLFLTLAQAADSAATEIYPHMLAYKGLLAAREAEEQLARDQPTLKPLLDELRLVRAGLARISRQTPATKEQQKEWRQRFDALEKDKERLEVRLARRSEVFRRFQELRDASAQDVAAAVPPKAAFVDFLFYPHYTPPPEGKGKVRTETRLLAFVLTGGGIPSSFRSAPPGPLRKRWPRGGRRSARLNPPTSRVGISTDCCGRSCGRTWGRWTPC